MRLARFKPGPEFRNRQSSCAKLFAILIPVPEFMASIAKANQVLGSLFTTEGARLDVVGSEQDAICFGASHTHEGRHCDPGKETRHGLR